jgi:hypothetical protein
MERRNSVLVVLGCIVVFYILVLCVSGAFFGAMSPGGPMDTRLLVPAVVLLIPLSVVRYMSMFGSVRNVVIRCVMFVVVPALLLLSNTTRTVATLRYQAEHGVRGYTHISWRESECIAKWRKFKKDVVTYTNGFDVIYFYEGDHTCTLPEKYVPTWSTRPNPMYQKELTAMANEVSSGKAMVLWFDRIDRDYLVSKKELECLFPGPDKVAKCGDGILFGATVRGETE